MKNRKYFLYINEENTGPFSEEEIKHMLVNNQISYTTFIFHDGLANWINIGELQEFSNRKIVLPPPPTQRLNASGTNKKKEWILLINNEEHGEISSEQITSLLKQKKLRQSTLARLPEWTEWKKLNEISDFKDYFDNQIKASVKINPIQNINNHKTEPTIQENSIFKLENRTFLDNVKLLFVMLPFVILGCIGYDWIFDKSDDFKRHVAPIIENQLQYTPIGKVFSQEEVNNLFLGACKASNLLSQMAERGPKPHFSDSECLKYGRKTYPKLGKS